MGFSSEPPVGSAVGCAESPARSFGGTIAAVAEARAFVTERLRRWDLESLVSDAELLTSELVTNAVLHARSDVTVTVAVADGVAEIGVTDRLERPARAAVRAPGGPRAVAASGLVDLVALEWGVAPLAGGKQVWFRLDIGAELAAPDRLPLRRRRPGAGPARVRALRRRGARPVGRPD